MFEISFGEILMIGIVALIVLGPERLPTVARTIGALVGRAQRFVASVKSDIQQHGQMAGFDDLKRDVQDAANVLRGKIESEVAEVRQLSAQISDAGQQLERDAAALLDEAHDSAPPAVVEVNEAQLELFDVKPVAAARDHSVTDGRE